MSSIYDSKMNKTTQHHQIKTRKSDSKFDTSQIRKSQGQNAIEKRARREDKLRSAKVL